VLVVLDERIHYEVSMACESLEAYRKRKNLLIRGRFEGLWIGGLRIGMHRRPGAFA